MILLPQQTWQAVVTQLQSAKKVMIVSHQSPDADTIGSQLALFDALQNMGIAVRMCNSDHVPRICRYLPCSAQIEVGKSPDVSDIDTMIAVDAGAKSRLGFDAAFFEGKTLINIDHHASNPLYADINVVNADYCATGAMIFDLIQHLGQALTKNSAVALYAAILTDTASFQVERVSADVHRMVAILIEAGAEPAVAAHHIYDSQPLARVSLLTLTLQTLTTAHAGRSVWLHVNQDMLDKTGVALEDTEGFIDFGRSIDGVEVVIFIRPDQDKRWKVSFRGKHGRDVAALAAQLGGGGHRYAAGCAVSGTLEEVYAQLHAVVDDTFS
ncbi:MAG: bifunctional oligoribonuclease/PAP phosphatase NrnA [Mariprofundaceae bacterium]|nr:bifunctional oligoribonuclease/PAP phosphatase NrnA [Mariprofundaceae bacterium]